MADLPKRRFTKSQQGRLDDIPGKLDDILSGYEKIRKAYEAQKALDPNTPTNPLVLQRLLLKDKFREFVVAVVRLWVNINQSLRLDQFRDQLESDARDFKKWLSEELRRRIHRDHLPFFDWAAIEKAVDGEVSYWVGEKQRAIPVQRPWESPAKSAQTGGQPTTSHQQETAEAKPVKGRGRPQTIPEDRKVAAQKLKDEGGTNRDAAIVIYGKKYPTTQEVKNVPALLKHHRAKIEKNLSVAPEHPKPFRKTNKDKG